MNTIRRFAHWVLHPPVEGHEATILMRLVGGGIFLSEGILKFVYVNQGVGRMTKLGFPAPEFTADFVATLEIVGGLPFMLGLLTRVLAIPFIFEMIVAIVSTKISLYLGTSPLAPPPVPPKLGFWAVMHESRSDYGQLLTSDGTRGKAWRGRAATEATGWRPRRQVHTSGEFEPGGCRAS